VFANSTMRLDTPPRSMIAPASMKKGMAKRGKEFAPATMRMGINVSGRLPEKIIAKRAAIASANPIGTLIAKHITNVANKIVSIEKSPL